MLLLLLLLFVRREPERETDPSLEKANAEEASCIAVAGKLIGKS